MADRETPGKNPSLRHILRSLTNVEKQLEQLLVRNGGERKEPRAAEGKVTCKVRCTIISLGQINTINQEFWAEVYITVRWQENELRGRDAQDVDWCEHWDPQIYFVNAMEVHCQERWHAIIDNNDGSTDVKLCIRMRATFKALMQLHYFPFDHQELTIKLMSDWQDKYVEFQNDRSIRDCIRTDTFTDVHEWELQEHVLAEPVKEEKEKTGSINEFPHYHISMHVRRRYAHYLWNLVLVIFLILLLSFASFSISSDDAEGRFNITVALLLTAVAYKFIVNTKLPMIPYLTLLDRYVLYCLIIHALMVIQNAISLALSGVVPNEKIVDYISFAVLGCLALGVNVTFAIIGIVKIRRTTAKMNMLKEKYVKICEDLSVHCPQFTDERLITTDTNTAVEHVPLEPIPC